MRNTIAFIAGALIIMAAVPYLVDIVKGKTKPNVVSWLTWTLLLAIGTAGAYAAHQFRTGLLTTGDLIGTGLTVILGLKYGIAKFSWFDGLCQIGALLGLVLWFVFNSPAVGIVAVIIVDFIGLLPTLKHSWQNPGEETWQTFAVAVVASGLTLISLTSFNTASLSYPIYLLLANAAVAVVVIYRRINLKIGLSRAGSHETLHE